jgi:TolA-binding protein
MKEQLYELSKPKPEPLPKQELETKKSTDKKKKLKKPSEMSIDELQEEIESNNARCEELEEQRESTDINTRIESDQEIRTLANRTSKLCEQKIALLNHQMSLLR